MAIFGSLQIEGIWIPRWLSIEDIKCGGTKLVVAYRSSVWLCYKCCDSPCPWRLTSEGWLMSYTEAGIANTFPCWNGLDDRAAVNKRCYYSLCWVVLALALAFLLSQEFPGLKEMLFLVLLQKQGFFKNLITIKETCNFAPNSPWVTWPQNSCVFDRRLSAPRTPDFMSCSKEYADGKDARWTNSIFSGLKILGKLQKTLYIYFSFSPWSSSWIVSIS